MRRSVLGALALLLTVAVAARAQTFGDFDGDAVGDSVDNCPFVANPSQEDSTPGDGYGDVCTCGDVDADGARGLRDVVVLRRALAERPPGVVDVHSCSVVGGSSDCDSADALRLREALAGTDSPEPVCRAAVGAGVRPGRLAVAGDSITRGFAADCECNFGFDCVAECLSGGVEQPRHSWFDGDDSSVYSLLDRYRFFDVSISADSSAAESGARMRGGDDSFAVQATKIASAPSPPDLVVVLLGGNDICSRDCTQPGGCSRPLFSDEEWLDAVEAGLDVLVDALPETAEVYLGSVPRVQDLFAVGKQKEDDESDVECEYAWEAFDICRIVTDEGSMSGEPQSVRLSEIEARQRRYNEILTTTAEAYTANATGQNPRGIRVVAEYAGEQEPSVGTFRFGPSHLNGGDCFHPSRQGQNVIAELLWQRSPMR